MATLGSLQALYAGTGLATFPLAPNAKVPFKGSHGFLDAKPESDWDSWPTDANIGVATGLRSGGLVVIDCDGKEGIKNFQKIVTRLHLKISTQVVSTPHGMHHYFRSPVAFASNASVLAQSVDVRAEGGYVVGYGSVVNGAPYSVARADLQVLPGELAALLTRTEPNRTIAAHGGHRVEAGDLLEGIEMYRDGTGRLRARRKGSR